MAYSGTPVPLTEFQRRLLADLAPSDDRYLAGGAAMHFAPNSTRYSDDLDFFHDSGARDWAHDSAWRFMPLVRDPLGGLLLHPVDVAVNKVLALAGRDEPRDFVDILFVHARVLPLAALCWAAPGKDPGFTPLSLLELLKRRGKYHPEDFTRLQMVEPFDLAHAKGVWLGALGAAEAFARARPADELGCLYYSTGSGQFVLPPPGADLVASGVAVHFGMPGGVLPRVAGQRIEIP
jgi:hypothetical protein